MFVYATPEQSEAIHEELRQIEESIFTKFIRAEVVAYDDLVACGNYAEAKAKGVLRTEGKEYIVKDGDVIEFKI
jgi:ribosome-binding ATPase YchF (GTP1/OBG family)